jgi:hypothetical protein
MVPGDPSGEQTLADERASKFAATIADLTARHRSVRLVVTGPRPAYSFCR